MSRPAKGPTAKSHLAPESELQEAAALAAKVAALPHQVEAHPSPAADLTGPRSSTSPRPSSWLGRLVYWLVCLITLSLVAVAVLRIVYHDGTHFLIWLNAFTRYVYLPAYVCLAWAVWKRRWLLALANIAVVGLHVAWIVPDFVRDRRFDHAAESTANAPTSSRVRIFFANVRALNTEHDALLQEIQKVDPDVIVLVEFSWLWHLAYRHSPVIEQYRYGRGFVNAELGMVHIFSRLPLKSTKIDIIAHRAVQTVELPIGSETLRIIGLHAPRPMAIRNDDYEGYWAQTIPKLLAEKGPVVVIGDFNATQYSSVYKQLTSDRFRSAHQDRGRGYATTWPNGQYWLPPLIRIDQAFLSPQVECLGIWEGEGRGSDHKPLIIDVQVHAASR